MIFISFFSKSLPIKSLSFKEYFNLRVLFFYIMISVGASIVISIGQDSSLKAMSFSDYKNHYDGFSKVNCSKETQEKFNQLFKDYQGSGFFLPLLKSGELDKLSIKKLIPQLKRKLKWIEMEIAYLTEFKSFSLAQKKIDQLEDKLKEIKLLKSKYYKSSPLEKKEVLDLALKKIDVFKSEFEFLGKTLSFFTTLDFPVNYFEYRKKFDFTPKNLKRKRNSLFLLRKVYEDGAQEPDHSRSDAYFRSVFSMVTIELQKYRSGFLPMTLEYDLDYLLQAFKNLLKKGKKKNFLRMLEWKERTHKTLVHYTKALKKREAKSLSSKFAQAKEKLYNFVYKKQANVFTYLLKSQDKRKDFLPYFILDTLLLNEVGGFDRSEGLERRDVIRVFLNRLDNSKYNFIDERDNIYPFLHPKFEKLASNDALTWLSTFFKTGEFSFTYYFIKSNSKIFCPLKSTLYTKLRKENLKIITSTLDSWRKNKANNEAKNKINNQVKVKDKARSNNKQKALRYFSRISMTGRIDMSSIWEDYSAIERRVGYLIKKRDAKKLYLKLKKSNYLIRDKFNYKEFKNLEVIEMEDKLYVHDPRKSLLFTFRDPNIFRYYRAIL